MTRVCPARPSPGERSALVDHPPGERAVVEPGRLLGGEAQHRRTATDDQLAEAGPVDAGVGGWRSGQAERPLEAVEGEAVGGRLGDELISLADAAHHPAVAHDEHDHLGADPPARPVECSGPAGGGHAEHRPLRRGDGAEEHVGGRPALERQDADVGAVGVGHDMDEDATPVVGDRPAERVGQAVEKGGVKRRMDRFGHGGHLRLRTGVHVDRRHLDGEGPARGRCGRLWPLAAARVKGSVD